MGLIIKLVIYPIVLLLAHGLLAEVQFQRLYQIVIIAAVLAIIAHYAERIFLNNNNNIFSTSMDFGILAFLLWASQFTFPGIRITFNGVIIIALVLATIEYIQHRWLLTSFKINIK